MADIGEKLRLARIEAGLTIREAEELTGVNKDGISKIERGVREPYPLTVARLAKAYGRSAEEFLLEEPTRPKAEAQPSSPLAEKAQKILPSLSAEQAQKAQKRLESPSFWAAKEMVEAGQITVVAGALESYMKRRAEMYEDELKDSSSPHFRTATAAALWAEALHQEADMVAKLFIEEFRSVFKPLFRSLESADERAWASVKLVRSIAESLAAFSKVRQQADQRIAAMSNQPDELAQKRLTQARQKADESARQVRELRAASQ